MVIPKDLIYYLIPFTSYFDLENLLTACRLPPDEIKRIKAIVYSKRIKLNDVTYNDFPFDWSCQIWQIEGISHREDGPARHINGELSEWYYNGVLHREDGPAYTFTNVFNIIKYYRHGLLHRTDGPAVIERLWGGLFRERHEYYVNGVPISKEYKFVTYPYPLNKVPELMYGETVSTMKYKTRRNKKNSYLDAKNMNKRHSKK